MDNNTVLNTGKSMPLLGLGTYKMVDEEQAVQNIQDAVSVGYRLIDTASAYKNEEVVGRAIRECQVPREELFVTTKVWNTAQRIGNVAGAFERSLERLGLDYVDLYLVHWPVPGCTPETWKEMERIYKSGRAKAIGVSNFNEVELSELIAHAEIIPAVNQIEYHPLWNREPLRQFCQKNGIAVQAYAPLARGAYMENDALTKIAERHFRSVSQIGLRWLIQKGVGVIPKSSRLDRLLENSQIFDFELDADEMEMIDSLNQNYRSANVPEDLRS